MALLSGASAGAQDASVPPATEQPAAASPQDAAGEPAASALDTSAAAAAPRARRAAPRTPGGSRAHAGGTLDERVSFYAKELNLDTHQQSLLRALLTEQRQQVQRLWADTAVPPAQRIYATKAIEDAISDRIRAMLNEEQRKQYNPPRPPHDKLIEAQSTAVEDWMRLLSARQPN